MNIIINYTKVYLTFDVGLLKLGHKKRDQIIYLVPSWSKAYRYKSKIRKRYQCFYFDYKLWIYFPQVKYQLELQRVPDTFEIWNIHHPCVP